MKSACAKTSPKSVKHLPEPTEQAKNLSALLRNKIIKQINRHGSLPFSTFMEMALYTPELGYYAGGLKKFGHGGDFITAPEVSPIFSRCLARQAAQVLEKLPEANIIEFGAGQGTMAIDIIKELIELGQPFHRYYIIEISDDLKARQKKWVDEQLPNDIAQKVIWLNELPKTPISAVVLANEVLDAMPFERIRIEPNKALQGFVTYDIESKNFQWDYQPITHKRLNGFINSLIQHLGQVSDLGYETEINLTLENWLNTLNNALSSGAVFLIDYGYNRVEYYQPARVMGTLRCHYQHRAHGDPFYFPGLQDITSHVDFTAVAENAYDSGFKVAGYTTQAHFLMASGLLEMSASINADITDQLKVAQQIKTLTLPDEMGESFKVIGLTKHFDDALIGFSVRDLRHQL